MFKPIEAARVADKFTSLDELAKQLVARFPDLKWPATRALAVKVGGIDRGDKVWWIKRHAQAGALAALLEMPLVDLGLHDAPTGDAFEFVAFPELPPISLAREAACDIGYVDGSSGGQSDEKLAFWLTASPPRHTWRAPDDAISWLQFQPGAGLSFFWAALCARTSHDYIATRRLLDVSERLRQPRNLIVRLEQPLEDADLVALGGAHPDLNMLIVAPFGAPPIDADTPETWIPAWDLLTGEVDHRVASLTNPNGLGNAIARYDWRLHDDWQDRLLEWVEKRMGSATSDTLFTALGVRKWLASFPRGWQFVKGPADLLAVCRLCHVSPETELPLASDVDAGQRLLQRVAGTDDALSSRFTSLVAARLEARELAWTGGLTSAQWAALGPAPTRVPDEATLLEIANGANVSARRQRARALAEQIRATSMAPLIQARLLIETRYGTLALAPQFLVDLVARDRLMQAIRDEPVEHWAMYCHDEARRALVDAALSSMSLGELLPVLERLKLLPERGLDVIGVGEAMFMEIGRRVCGALTVPVAFACLADMVLPRLAMDDGTPRLWTRTQDAAEDILEWSSICWAWSLWCDAPDLELPADWAWYFPGWAPERIAVEMPWLWVTELPDQPILSHAWQRMTSLAMQLAQRIADPPAHPPNFLTPMLLVESIRGRWTPDASWLATIMGDRCAMPIAAAENLLLDEMEKIGPAAAARLLPALMEYVLSDQGDRFRSIIFYRSRIRTRVLQNVSFADVIRLLNDEQLATLWQAPHALPPHLLCGMLENAATLPSASISVCTEAVTALKADHVRTLSRLLGAESLGWTAAERIWKVAPEEAERLLKEALDDQLDDHPPGSLRLLILSAPVTKTGMVARAVLSGVGDLSESERIDWARQRLCAAGAHAEAVGLVLDWTQSAKTMKPSKVPLIDPTPSAEPFA